MEADYPDASWNRQSGRGDPFKLTIVRLGGKGDAEVAKGYPGYENCRVYVNSGQWFDGMPERVWEFQVGGYRVCEKWLKDRRGRVLSKEDIEHYGKIVVAIRETIRLMGKIDKTIDAHGGWPGAFITDPKVLESLKPKKA
jgi:hypothetical protein